MTLRQTIAEQLSTEMPVPPGQVNSARGRGGCGKYARYGRVDPAHLCPRQRSPSPEGAECSASAVPSTPPPPPPTTTDGTAACDSQQSQATHVDHSRALLRAFAALGTAPPDVSEITRESDEEGGDQTAPSMADEDPRDEHEIDKDNEKRIAGNYSRLYRMACIRKVYLRSARDAAMRKCDRLEARNAKSEAAISKLKADLEAAQRELGRVRTLHAADQRKLLDINTRLQTCDSSRRLGWAKFYESRNRAASADA